MMLLLGGTRAHTGRTGPSPLLLLSSPPPWSQSHGQHLSTSWRPQPGQAGAAANTLRSEVTGNGVFTCTCEQLQLLEQTTH